MNIIDNTSNIRLRIDYFGMPGICRKLVDIVHRLYGGEVPERRLMTTYDQELVDLDGISSVLDVTLEEIMQRPVSIFSASNISDFPARIYVGEYFFMANVMIYEGAKLESYDIFANAFATLLDNIIKELGKELKVMRMTSTVYSPCIIDLEGLENGLNLEFFPIIAEHGKNARYAENFEEDGFDTTLIWDLSFGKINVDEQPHEAYRIECTVNNSIAVIPDDTEGCLKQMFKKAVERTNKYYR